MKHLTYKYGYENQTRDPRAEKSKVPWTEILAKDFGQEKDALEWLKTQPCENFI